MSGWITIQNIGLFFACEECVPSAQCFLALIDWARCHDQSRFHKFARAGFWHFYAHLLEGLVIFDSLVLITVLIPLSGLGVGHLAWAGVVIAVSYLSVLLLLFQGQ